MRRDGKFSTYATYLSLYSTFCDLHSLYEHQQTGLQLLKPKFLTEQNLK